MPGPKTPPVAPVFSENIEDLGTPGGVVIVDPDVAGEMGAFEEDALSETDAWEANGD